MNETKRYKLYFSRIFYTDVNVIDNPFNNSNELNIIENMDIYPNKNSIRYINDILVIKLG